MVKRPLILIIPVFAVLLLFTQVTVTAPRAEVLLHSRMAKSWLERINTEVETYGPGISVLEELEDFLQVYPNSSVSDQAFLLAARLYFERDEYGKSINYYSRLIREFPKSSYREKARYGLAYARYNKDGETEQAKIVLEKTLRTIHDEEGRGDGAGKKETQEAPYDIENIGSDNSNAPINKGEAVVAVILPLTGKYAAYGEKAMRGVRLASSDFKRNNPGATKPKIKIINSGNDPDNVNKALDKIINKPTTAALLGPLMSNTAHAVSRLAQKRKVPVIVLSQRSAVPALGNYVFRNFLTPEDQARTLAHYACNDLSLDTFAILHPENTYGRDLAIYFSHAIEEQNCTIVATHSYAASTVDFSGAIKELFDITTREYMKGRRHISRFSRTLQPDALFIPDTFQRAGLIAPFLAYYDIDDVTLLGTNGWNAPGLVALGKEHVEDSVFVDGFFGGSTRPGTIKFVNRFKKIYDHTPGVLEAHAYDSAMLLFNAMNTEKDSITRRGIRKRLSKTKEFSGAVSDGIEFNELGEAQKELFIMTVKDGVITEVE